METKVKERPILFNSEMVRAILDGRKQITRRVMKTQPHDDWTEIAVEYPYGRALATYRAFPNGGSARWGIEECPYGQPGDRLNVREAWAAHDCFDDIPPRDIPEGEAIWFSGPNGHGATEANGSSLRNNYMGCWRLSIHMPRWASRITLEVTEVRVERVQSISEGDAKSEGVLEDGWEDFVPGGPVCTSHVGRLAFQDLWDSINHSRGYGWDTNPFVWVVSFKLLEQAEVSDG